jgi:hypothetical protein
MISNYDRWLTTPPDESDWHETSPYSQILEKCEWLSDNEFEANYEVIGDIVMDVVEWFIKDSFGFDSQSYSWWLSRKMLNQYVIGSAGALSIEVKRRFDLRKESLA